MYFPIGWPQTLAKSQAIHQIVANIDQTLFILLSFDSISIWYCRPVVQIVRYQRTAKSIHDYGTNVAAVWKSDSSQIVVQTSTSYLLFYNVVISDDNDTVLNLIEPSKQNIRHESFAEEQKVPALLLDLHHKLFVEEEIACIMSAEEEVVISTRKGALRGVEWDGQYDESFHLTISLPQSYHQKKDEQQHSYFISEFKYSTIIGGFALVFNNGFGAFLPLNDNTSNYTQLQLIGHVDNAVCTTINHKYAFIVFGLLSSNGVICSYDEVDRRFIVSYHLTLPSNLFPDVDKILGPLSALQWTPDSTVLATIWKNGGFALWSVFGSLLSCSLSWNYSSALDIDTQLNVGPFQVTSLAFGKEGFHLWMATRSLPQSSETDADSADLFDSVCKLSLAKSVLAANPCSATCLETVLLASEDRIFVGGSKNSSLIAQSKLDDNDNLANNKSNNGKLTTMMSNLVLCEQETNTVDSLQWITISLPPSYSESNWPIRYFAIDSQTSQNIAIAGLNGFAMYSLLNRRWKLFGNEIHEKEVIVTGGFLWFHDYLIAGCYNLESDSFEIRAYSHHNKLDNAYAKMVTIENEVHLLSIHHNRLLALCSNGSIFLYDLHLFKQPGGVGSRATSHQINISAPIRVILSNLEVFPDCVTVCLLTDLHVEMYNSIFQSESNHRNQVLHSSASRPNSILINICGRVLLLEMDIDTTVLPLSSDEDSDTSRQYRPPESPLPKPANGLFGQNTIKFRKVVKLASNVENLWLLPQDDVQLSAFRSSTYTNRVSVQLRPHLVTSLYLSCGVQGMAIWLSLEHSIRPQCSLLSAKGNSATTTTTADYPSGDNERTFISKRIMLPIHEIASTIYPLAIRFRDAIVLGAESDITQPNLFSISPKDSTTSVFIPFCVIKRTSQVYLHYILRELLRRNLGYRAWEIANTCTALPHFVHSLELLLHGVLEEEASSSQPIPDALLPRVVEFIRAFPVFLRTVIHCARKTELALWPHLFSIVGSPKDLFQQCLLEGQLETASSYIIVLQNLEKPEVASKCANRLLQAARIAGCWLTVKELKRFLRATNHAEEVESLSSVNQTSDERENETEQQKSELKEPSTPTSHNTSNSPVPHSSCSTNASTGQTCAKVPELNTNHKPGAVVKESKSVDGEPANGYIEENIMVKEEVDEECSINDAQSLSNHSEDSLNPTKSDEEVVCTAKTLCPGSNGIIVNDRKRPKRAYPGSILRLSYDDHSALHSPKPIASSHSSISSYSSVSSSAISSASVSPIVHKNRVVVVPPSELSGKMLNVVPISLDTDDASQCTIS